MSFKQEQFLKWYKVSVIKLDQFFISCVLHYMFTNRKYSKICYFLIKHCKAMIKKVGFVVVCLERNRD